MDAFVGAGALIEDDDRARNAAILHLGFPNNWYSRFYLWGRTYGPVTERDGILTISKRTDIFGLKTLHASVGFSAMAERTSITYSDHPSENSTFTATNFGAVFGLHYDLYTGKSVNISASWDSNVFAAGQAIIFLVTGRKEILGITAGMMF
jgi:hypothetical protein